MKPQDPDFNPEQWEAFVEKETLVSDKAALALVDHLEIMGAASCQIPILDRATEMMVTVMPRAVWNDICQRAGLDGNALDGWWVG